MSSGAGKHGEEVATLSEPKADDAHAVAAKFALVVVDGPDRDLRFVFDETRPARVLVGQSPACHLRLRDAHVSRRHAALEIGPRGLRVVDLGSTNGTTVNGMQVVEVHLWGGETVQVGTTTLLVERMPTGPVPTVTAMRFGRMVGTSLEMRRLYPLCDQLAKAQIPVVIEGETGTGKEVLAEALHEASSRAEGPFVIFDCTAVPSTLVESTLFGHERGAFTGAESQRRGVFEEAHEGTLFIDEIGDLDPALQTKLLRAIENSEVQRVGSNQWTRVDVRIIAATRRDLDREVQAGRFRDDLFFRLAVGRVELPPLRRRVGDIPVLTRLFWRAFGGDARSLPPALLARFEDYDWPGNVRELSNAVERALALGDSAVNDMSALARSVGGTTTASLVEQAPGGDVLDRILNAELPLTRARGEVVAEFERRYVKRILERYDGNVVRAAAASGIARRYFQILRARYAKEKG